MNDLTGSDLLHLALLGLTVRERRTEEAVLEALRAGDARMHGEFRLCLAWALRHALRREKGVRSVDVIGSTLGEGVRKASDLDLVVRMEEADDAARERWRRLDREVSAAYVAMMGSLPRGFRLLDLHVVSDADDAAGKGFAATLRGSRHPRYPVPL